MKKSIVLLLICYGFILYGQDNQWYIWDNEGWNGVINSHQYTITSNDLYIHNVRHPAPFNSADNIRYANDVFIIFDDGSYYNSFMPSSDAFMGTNDPYSFGYKITGVTNIIEYLYFTNVYEDNDKPKFVIVSNNNVNTFIDEFQNSYSQVSISKNTDGQLATNHKLKLGTDVTLILPQKHCNEMLITYDEKILHSPTLLQPDGASISLTVDGVTLSDILGGTKPYKNKFINFKTVDILPTGYTLGQQIEFTATCTSANTSWSDTISQPINNHHDPNFVEVKCIFRKKKNILSCPFNQKKYRYYVQYHVECFNDGGETVGAVKFKFNLPPSVIPNSLSLTNWYFGGKTGCKYDIPKPSQSLSDDEVTFNFEPLERLLSVGPVKNDNNTAWVEFCVELNVNSWQDVHQADLYLSSPTSHFGNDVYPITQYIDPKIKPEYIRRTTIRPSCNCECPISSDTGSGQQ